MRTKRKQIRSSTIGVLGTVCLTLGLAIKPAGSEPRPLNRSLYVPIEFSLCEHLGGAVLYQDDAATGKLPTKRVFQFTYYPALEETFPKVVQIRVEGSYVSSGEPFTARLAVTPHAVHSGQHENPHETSRQMTRQRGKIDARLKPRTFVLQCPRYCGRQTAPVATAASSLPEDAPR